jgi:hypothetical protein
MASELRANRQLFSSQEPRLIRPVSGELCNNRFVPHCNRHQPVDVGFKQLINNYVG